MYHGAMWAESNLSSKIHHVNMKSRIIPRKESPKSGPCCDGDGVNVKDRLQPNRISVEMVDRGVGPTPVPNPVPSVDFPGPFLGIPPYLPDPRANMHESPLGYAGCLFSSLPYSFNPPIMVNSTTNEGRYHWPPGAAPLQAQSSGHGAGASESFSDWTSGVSLRSPYPGDAAKAAALASRFHWEQYQRLAALHQHGTLTMQQGMDISPNGFSPFHYRISPSGFPVGYQDGNLPPNPFSPHLAFTATSQKSAFSKHPATPGSGSITLPGSLEGSRLNSPHPSVTLKNSSRKRALSHSPLDFGLDIENLTRSSESSLLLQSLGPASRTSSNASGSYGHLSAMSLSALGSGIHMLGHPALRHGAVAPGMLYSPILHPCFLPPYQALGAQGVAGQSSLLQDPNSSNSAATTKPEQKNSSTGPAQEVGCCSIVSSTVGANNVESRRIKMKKEEGGQHAVEEPSEVSVQMQEANDGNEASSVTDRTLQEKEPDFYETNCHWKNCSQQHETQDELVKHLNQDHIASNKKLFVCEWEGCQREQKPFKAQYMLVVHMRRHTGEKPHQCQFQGCSKAYSRLENLKTHLRSHTGEKPYLCEHPGCSKAFSNASDRAKHQNRTHSNAKPYACKAPGCTKCYTDPSSLRKHVKTVHGADFYANKKHKGEAFYSDREQNEEGYSSSRNYGANTGGGKGGGGRGRQRYTLTDRQPDVTDDSHSSSSRSLDILKVQDCLRVTPLHPTSNSARKKFSRAEAEGSKIFHQHRDRSEPIVGNLVVTRCLQDTTDFDCNTENLVTSTIGGGQILTETEEDILSEFLLPATTVVAVSRGEENEERSSVICTGPGLPHLGLRSKFTSKRIPGNNDAALPPLGNTTGRILPLHGVHRGSLNPNSQKTEIQARTPRKIVDNMLIREAMHSSRRGSNTSTLSSYMSSIRSDSSPFQQLNHSSRQPSESSQNSASQRSIAQSPYEYDISDFHPGSSLQRSDVANTLSSMLTSRMPKTRLGNSITSLHASSGIDRRGRGDLIRFLMSRRDHSDGRLPPVTGGYETPSRTPLPHEIPNYDIRRASDPVRTGLGSLSTVREFQRCHSLNAVRRPTAPKPPQKHIYADLYSNYNSSCTSIATDFSLESEVDIGNAFLEETDDVIGCCTTVDEALLEKQMFQDACHDDLIIPDEMQEYLDANGLGSVSTLSPKDQFDLNDGDLMGQDQENQPGQFVGESQNVSTLQQTRVPNGWNGDDMWPPCTNMEVGNQQVMDCNEGIAMELEGCSTNMHSDLQSASNPQLLLHPDVCQGMSWMSEEKFSRLRRTENQSNQPSTLSLGSQMYMNKSRGCSVQSLNSNNRLCVNSTQSHSVQPEVQVSKISQSKLASARLLGTTAGGPSAQGAVTDRCIYTSIPASNPIATTSSNVAAQRKEILEKHLLQQNGFCRENLTEVWNTSPNLGTVGNKFDSQEGAGTSMDMSLISEQYFSDLVFPCFSEDNLSRHYTTADQINGDPQQVSSSTDVGGVCASNENVAQLTGTVNSMGDCLLDSLGSISLENVMSSPSMMTNGSTSSTVSRMTTPRAEDKSSPAQSSYLKTSNMAVNDMTSLLAQLVQENKYRNMCG